MTKTYHAMSMPEIIAMQEENARLRELVGQMGQTSHPDDDAVEYLMNETHYVTCISCGHMITMIENNSLRFRVDCPSCGMKKQFGPGVYIEGFQGYTLKQALEQRRRKGSVHK